MSWKINALISSESFSEIPRKVKAWLIIHPEWWVWFISAYVWSWFIVSHLTSFSGSGLSANVFYCMPIQDSKGTSNFILQTGSVFRESAPTTRILETLQNGMVPWAIMIVAMMFPLLNEPVRHVTFSVRRKDKNLGIVFFLLGYLIIWTMIGVVFLLFPVLIELIVSEQNSLIITSIGALGFGVAAALIWHPSRPRRMTQCSMTLPIRIDGWSLYFDSAYYGIRIGLVCFVMCWAPMMALVLVHHTFLIMLLSTLILIYERYFIPHDSKIPGYAWGMMALAIVGLEVW